ncbi:hypothetical protein BH09PAT2_BH09PAT2_11280 [soil metagenome]
MANSKYTPINITSLTESFNHIRVKTLKRSKWIFNIDKYNAFLFFSIIIFIAGVGFWSYVNFYIGRG